MNTIAFWGRVKIGAAEDCWPWRRAMQGGDLLVYETRRNIGAPRRAWEINTGEAIPKGLEVLHSCDNPICCNPNHLRLGTHAENMRDMVTRQRNHKTRAFGEAHGLAKLTCRDVLMIRSSTKSAYSIAKELGVTKRAVLMARRGETWTHIKGESTCRTVTHESIFWSKLARKQSGCWVWTGIIGNLGYGRTAFQGRDTTAHRLAFRFAFGEIPKGAKVYHKCHNRACCNPSHLTINAEA